MGRKSHRAAFTTITLVAASSFASAAFAQAAAPPTGREQLPAAPPSTGSAIPPVAPPSTTEPSAPQTGSDVAPEAPPSGSAPAGEVPPTNAAPAQEGPSRPIVETPLAPETASPAPPSVPPSGPMPPVADYAPGEPHERASRKWYGWQTLLTDAASIAFIAMGASANHEGSGLVTVGALGYFFAPAIVHGVHGNGGTAFGSIGMRVLPPLLLIVGLASCYEGSGSCDGGGGALLLIGALGFPAVIAIDAAALSYEKGHPEPPRSASLHVAPFFDPKTHRSGLSLGGSF